MILEFPRFMERIRSSRIQRQEGKDKGRGCKRTVVSRIESPQKETVKTRILFYFDAT